MSAKGDEECAKQLTRLNNMKGDSMAADLKQWVVQRINILSQINAKAA